MTVGHGHTVSLALSNPNHLTVGGELDMFTATSGSASTKKKITHIRDSLLHAYRERRHGCEAQALERQLRELLHHRRLRVVVNATTTAGGVSTPAKSYGVTLSAMPTAKRKH